MSAEEDTDSKGGLLDSARNMAATLIAMVHTRLDLFSTEVEEGREWLSAMLVWTLIALFFAGMAVILATLLVVVVFWDSYRLAAIITLLGMFILGAAFAGGLVHRMGRNKPRLFSASIAELAKDKAQLSTRHES